MLNSQIETVYQTFDPERIFEQSAMISMLISVESHGNLSKIAYWMQRLLREFNPKYPECVGLTAITYFGLAVSCDMIQQDLEKEQNNEILGETK